MEKLDVIHQFSECCEMLVDFRDDLTPQQKETVLDGVINQFSVCCEMLVDFRDDLTPQQKENLKLIISFNDLEKHIKE